MFLTQSLKLYKIIIIAIIITELKQNVFIIIHPPTAKVHVLTTCGRIVMVTAPEGRTMRDKVDSNFDH